jgi:hypothetical protein
MEAKVNSHFVKNAQKGVLKRVERLHIKTRRSLRTQRENRVESLPEREQHCYRSGGAAGVKQRVRRPQAGYYPSKPIALGMLKGSK